MLTFASPLVRGGPPSLPVFPRAFGRERLEQGHSSFERHRSVLQRALTCPASQALPIRARRSRSSVPSGVAKSCTPLRSAGFIRRASSPCRLQFVGKSRRGRGRQALDLGEMADTERAVANHRGERRRIGRWSARTVHPAQLTGQADHRQAELGRQHVWRVRVDARSRHPCSSH